MRKKPLFFMLLFVFTLSIANIVDAETFSPVSPANGPTGVPLPMPTGAPTPDPTFQPVGPAPGPITGVPSPMPTGAPTPDPTFQPVGPVPGPTTGVPSPVPTGAPTPDPTFQPVGPVPGPTTGVPSPVPTGAPTPGPTFQPVGPAPGPTPEPTVEPSPVPTNATTPEGTSGRCMGFTDLAVPYGTIEGLLGVGIAYCSYKTPMRSELGKFMRFTAPIAQVINIATTAVGVGQCESLPFYVGTGFDVAAKFATSALIAKMMYVTGATGLLFHPVTFAMLTIGGLGYLGYTIYGAYQAGPDQFDTFKVLGPRLLADLITPAYLGFQWQARRNGIYEALQTEEMNVIPMANN